MSAFVATMLLCSGLLLACTPSDSSIDKSMRDAADEINAQCPMTIDSETRLDNCMALPGKIFQYNYTMVNYAYDQFDQSALAQVQEETTPQMINFVKSSSDLKQLRDYEITFKFVIRSNDSYELMVITITPQDYK